MFVGKINQQRPVKILRPVFVKTGIGKGRAQALADVRTRLGVYQQFRGAPAKACVCRFTLRMWPAWSPELALRAFEMQPRQGGWSLELSSLLFKLIV